MKIISPVLVFSLLCAAWRLDAAPDRQPAGRISLTCPITDTHFANGVRVNAPKEFAGHKEIGQLRGLEGSETPTWNLSQWNTRTPFSGDVSPSSADKNRKAYKIGSKEIIFGRPNSPNADIVLGLNSVADFDGKRRPASVRWPALYVWQRFGFAKSIADLATADFAVDVRLIDSVNVLPSMDSDRRQDAAQFTAFFTLQSLNKAESDFGDYVWFGLPIYDNRFIRSPHHVQGDKGTKKLIYLVDSRTFMDGSTHDKRWTHIEANLLPEMRAAIREAKRRRFFEDDTNEDDVFIKSINIGWELPGSFDARMQLKNLSFCTN